MDSYVDKIMTNHIFNSESSEDMYHLYSEVEPEEQPRYQKGGDPDNQDDKPRGGFPPIFIVSKDDKDEEKSKNRQLSSRKTSVSIRDILKSKK